MPYFDDQKTYREKAGMRISDLSRETRLDRGTITRSEKHHNCTTETLIRIINALNEIFYRQNGRILDPDKLITETSRYADKQNKK